MPQKAHIRHSPPNKLPITMPTIAPTGKGEV